jgi:hypothetical protein
MSQIRLSDINKNSVVKIRLSVWVKSKYSQGNSTIPAANFYNPHFRNTQADSGSITNVNVSETTHFDSHVHSKLCVLRYNDKLFTPGEAGTGYCEIHSGPLT